MTQYQAFNPRTKSWVKYEIKGNEFVPVDVKQRNSESPFRGVKIRGNRK